MNIPCKDFNLAATLDSGQVFGFAREENGAYRGNLLGEPCEVWQIGDTVHVSSTKQMKPEHVRRYFDLDFDLSSVYTHLKEIPASDPDWFDSVRGLRLIRQDSWEALACFILSSNNNVKRIQGIYKNLVEYFSRRARRQVPVFPSSGEIAKTHERILRQIGLGYRAPFLQRSAQFLSVNPDYLSVIQDSEYEQAIERIISFPGIGPKVADCVFLYGFHGLEAFPVDVWMLRVMRKLYFKNRGVSEKRVHAFGRKKWGSLAGYVQQYLFHSARTGILFRP